MLPLRWGWVLMCVTKREEIFFLAGTVVTRRELSVSAKQPHSLVLFLRAFLVLQHRRPRTFTAPQQGRVRTLRVQPVQYFRTLVFGGRDGVRGGVAPGRAVVRRGGVIEGRGSRATPRRPLGVLFVRRRQHKRDLRPGRGPCSRGVCVCVCVCACALAYL